MKKKICAILLAGAMVFGMTGCGNNKAKSYSKYVTLGDYKSIEYVMDVTEVTDDDIQAQIDSFLNSHSETEEITDRPVKKGDTVNIDFKGTKDGEAFDGGTSEGYDLEIGSGSFIEGFEDGLIGANIGDTVSLDLTFPEDYASEDLAGQDVNFEVKINSISVTNIPKLTDDLVKENTEYDTIAAYKESIRKDLEESNKNSAESKAKSDVFNKAVSNATITGYDEAEVKKLVDKEFDSFKQMAESYQQYGYSYEDVLASNGYTNEEELKDGITEYVKNYLNQVMVMYCIAKAEGITVTSDETDAVVKEYMETYSVQTEEEVYEYFGDDYFELSVLSDKIMTFLMDNAKQVDSTEAATESSADNADTTEAETDK